MSMPNPVTVEVPVAPRRSDPPWIESAREGEVVPIPTLPLPSMMKAVEVAVAEDVATAKTGIVPADAPATERVA